MNRLEPFLSAGKTIAVVSDLRASLTRYQSLADEAAARMALILRGSEATLARSYRLLDRIDRKAVNSWPPFQTE